MKKNIAVVTGGYSGESVISLMSADVVMRHLDAEKYNLFKVILTRDKWAVQTAASEISVDKNDFTFSDGKGKIRFDCVFMALHGTPAEDGKLQGYLDMLGIPYTCCGVTSSALSFNKALTLACLKPHGVLAAKSVVLHQHDVFSSQKILSEISLPCFVKPNEGGSSIATTKVKHHDELLKAVELAFGEGREVMVEEFIEGVEITCGVIRYKGKIRSLAITEIVSKAEFFDFHAKYHDQATEEITPARISIAAEAECKNVSEYIYRVLGCKGMIRIDYILRKDKLFLLEVNSIPGLTERSLLPQQALYCGISLKELFTEAVENALKGI